MPSKDSKPTREKLFEEYEDGLFRLVTHDAAEKEGSVFLEEIKRLEKNPHFQPDKETCEKFSQQLDVYLKKRKVYATRQRIFKSLNKSAAAILFAIILLFTTIASVEAVRVKVLNFFMDIHQKYTSFQLTDSNIASNNEKPIVNWSKAYVPTYIPNEYEVVKTSYSEHVKKIVLKNEQGATIIFTVLNKASKPGVDTENASILKQININGHKGTLVVKNFIVTIVWSVDDNLFILQAETSEDTAIKIAHGVKYTE